MLLRWNLHREIVCLHFTDDYLFTGITESQYVTFRHQAINCQKTI